MRLFLSQKKRVKIRSVVAIAIVVYKMAKYLIMRQIALKNQKSTVYGMKGNKQTQLNKRNGGSNQKRSKWISRLPAKWNIFKPTEAIWDKSKECKLQFLRHQTVGLSVHIVSANSANKLVRGIYPSARTQSISLSLFLAKTPNGLKETPQRSEKLRSSSTLHWNNHLNHLSNPNPLIINKRSRSPKPDIRL